MKLRSVVISGPLWQDIFTEGWEIGYGETLRCTNGLPEGAKCTGVFYKEWQGIEATPSLVFVFEHPDFEDVKEGDPIPRLDIVFERL